MTILDEISRLLGAAPEHVSALILSGAGGALVRALSLPEESWTRRALHGVIGALSAIFLGGVVGHLIDALTGAGISAYLAAGFLMGEGGIAAVHALRRRLLPPGGKDNG